MAIKADMFDLLLEKIDEYIQLIYEKDYRTAVKEWVNWYTIVAANFFAGDSASTEHSVNIQFGQFEVSSTLGNYLCVFDENFEYLTNICHVDIDLLNSYELRNFPRIPISKHVYHDAEIIKQKNYFHDVSDSQKVMLDFLKVSLDDAVSIEEKTREIEIEALNYGKVFEKKARNLYVDLMRMKLFHDVFVRKNWHCYYTFIVLVGWLSR